MFKEKVMARNILITGSSHGIGAGCAIAFARDEGANVGICGNKDAAGAEAVAKECEKFGVMSSVIAVSPQFREMFGDFPTIGVIFCRNIFD